MPWLFCSIYFHLYFCADSCVVRCVNRLHYYNLDFIKDISLLLLIIFFKLSLSNDKTYAKRQISGCSSAVERHLAKVDAVGSIPIIRSNLFTLALLFFMAWSTCRLGLISGVQGNEYYKKT